MGWDGMARKEKNEEDGDGDGDGTEAADVDAATDVAVECVSTRVSVAASPVSCLSNTRIIIRCAHRVACNITSACDAMASDVCADVMA